MDTAIIVIVVAASMFGYLNYLINRIKISVFIAPALLITSICTGMYLSGLINIMPLGIFLTITGGYYLLIKYRKCFSLSFLKGREFAIALCLLLIVYLLYYTTGSAYEDGDSMTHWGVIVKTMYRHNRLPNFANSEITYQSYPPAAACWIWFVQYLLGYGEARALLAQGLWMTTSVICLFAVNKTRSKTGDLLVFLIAFYLLQGLDSLRVDGLLALVVVAAIVVIVEEMEHSRRMFGMLIPFLLVIPMIKNSGLLFAYFVAAIAVYLTLRNNKFEKTAMLRSAAYVLLPAASWKLWSAHIDMVYAYAKFSRHSLSLTYMKNVFGDKSVEDIKAIINRFISKWFSFDNGHEWIVLILVVLISIIALFACDKKKEIKRSLLVNIGLYGIYKIGLLLMYLTNMPGQGALEIAGYARYQKTFTMVQLCMALIVYLVYVQSDVKKIRATSSRALCFVLLLAFPIAFISNSYQELMRPDYVNGGINRITQNYMKTVPGFDLGDKVILYDSYGFSGTFAGFALDNSQCTATVDLERIKEALTTNSERYRWLMVTENDDAIQNLLKELNYAEHCVIDQELYKIY